MPETEEVNAVPSLLQKIQRGGKYNADPIRCPKSSSCTSSVKLPVRSNIQGPLRSYSADNRILLQIGTNRLSSARAFTPMWFKYGSILYLLERIKSFRWGYSLGWKLKVLNWPLTLQQTVWVVTNWHTKTPISCQSSGVATAFLEYIKKYSLTRVIHLRQKYWWRSSERT